MLSRCNGANIARPPRVRIVAALLLALCTAGALAQGPGSGELRTPPPTPPLREPAPPGEPPSLKTPTLPGSAAPADNRSREAADRCAELSGAMRSQCLLEQQGGASGATSAPQPSTAPPPQNPR
jgi:hypothetical protein